MTRRSATEPHVHGESSDPVADSARSTVDARPAEAVASPVGGAEGASHAARRDGARAARAADGREANGDAHRAPAGGRYALRPAGAPTADGVTGRTPERGGAGEAAVGNFARGKTHGVAARTRAGRAGRHAAVEKRLAVTRHARGRADGARAGRAFAAAIPLDADRLHRFGRVARPQRQRHQERALHGIAHSSGGNWQPRWVCRRDDGAHDEDQRGFERMSRCSNFERSAFHGHLSTGVRN